MNVLCICLRVVIAVARQPYTMFYARLQGALPAQLSTLQTSLLLRLVAESSEPADRGRQPDSGIWRPPELAALLSSVRSFLGVYCIKELDVINLLQSAGAPRSLLFVGGLRSSLQKASTQPTLLQRPLLQ